MGKKILVVEDEMEMVEMLKFRLEANNYEVITAYDGQEALDVIQKDKPDLILLDLMIPKITGYEICKTLKSNERYKDIPVIIVTARTQEKDMNLAKELCVGACITKPYEPQVLLSKIREILER